MLDLMYMRKYSKDDIDVRPRQIFRDILVDHDQMYVLHDFSEGDYYDPVVRNMRQNEFAMISIQRHFYMRGDYNVQRVRREILGLRNDRPEPQPRGRAQDRSRLQASISEPQFDDQLPMDTDEGFSGVSNLSHHLDVQLHKNPLKTNLPRKHWWSRVFKW